MNYDKLSVLKERLRAVEGNDWFDPMRAAEVCLVPNIIVPVVTHLFLAIRANGDGVYPL
jgi:hypothetical protein